MDLYRLSDAEEVLDTGAEELFYAGGICLIEWPDRAEGILPPETIRLEFRITGEELRSISVTGPRARIAEIEDEN
jgi:tRNA threonylcarbamoyladenosine biosynthesis protein TsaE